jgi:glycosyltransferase involved in cell wall biosynthesis
MTTPLVSVLMPCKGRPEQTAALLPRLFSTAGRVAWELICIVDDDPASAEAIRAYNRTAGNTQAGMIELPQRQGYWKALAHGSRIARGRLLANIANDVLPGLNWLARLVRSHQQAFPDGMGVAGWNDGLLFDAHTGHLLIGRPLAEAWYGAACWPTFYDHLFGDTEICQRAMAEDRYIVDTRAVLFHNHPVIGKALDDVYRFSHQKFSQDEQIFGQRRAMQWPKL